MFCCCGGSSTRVWGAQKRRLRSYHLCIFIRKKNRSNLNLSVVLLNLRTIFFHNLRPPVGGARPTSTIFCCERPHRNGIEVHIAKNVFQNLQRTTRKRNHASCGREYITCLSLVSAGGVCEIPRRRIRIPLQNLVVPLRRVLSSCMGFGAWL